MVLVHRLVCQCFGLLLLFFFLPPVHQAWATDLTLGPTCTLVDAIHAANDDSMVGGCAAGSGADRILLTGDVVLAEPLVDRIGPTALPPITSTITIVGNGHSISRPDAAPRFRLFFVDNAELTLSDLTLANGSLDGADGEPGENGADGTPGGADLDGGDGGFGGHGGDGAEGGQGAGIYLDGGTLTLNNVLLTGHSARGGNGGPGGRGGDGGNGQRGGRGGKAGEGGDGGPGGRGGAIFVDHGSVDIRDSQFENNSVAGGQGTDGGSGGDGGDSLVSSFSHYGHGGGGGAPGWGGRGGAGAALYIDKKYMELSSVQLTRSTVSHNDVSAGASADGDTTEDGQMGLNPGQPLDQAVSGGGQPAAADGGQGAIFNSGELTVVDSLISANLARGGSGGSAFVAGGAQIHEHLGSQSGGPGGIAAIALLEGELRISGSTFVDNRAQGGSGGARIDSDRFEIDDGDGGDGGGLLGYSDPCQSPLACEVFGISTLEITNSTFSSNLANGGDAPGTGSGGDGGVAVLSAGFINARLLHVSVVNNSAQSGSGGGDQGQQGLIFSHTGFFPIGEITLLNSLFFDNQGTLCGPGVSPGEGNLADLGECPGIPDSLTGVDPILSNNGGPTPTHALRTNSSARDVADATLCTEAGGVDQRGIFRQANPPGLCDVGAFEYVLLPVFSQGFE